MDTLFFFFFFFTNNKQKKTHTGDALHGDLEMALQDSDSNFVAIIFGGKPMNERGSSDNNNDGSSSGSKTRSKKGKSNTRRNTKLPDSIAYKFKNQLKSLNTELLKTEPHYIRCVKTNSIKSVHYFEREFLFGYLEP